MQIQPRRYSASTIERQRQALETQWSVSLAHRLQQHLGQLGKRVIRFLAPADSLHIEQRQHQGQILWQVYDRTTQQRHQFTAEQDLRVWLDQRYYQ